MLGHHHMEEDLPRYTSQHNRRVVQSRLKAKYTTQNHIKYIINVSHHRDSSSIINLVASYCFLVPFLWEKVMSHPLEEAGPIAEVEWLLVGVFVYIEDGIETGTLASSLSMSSSPPNNSRSSSLALYALSSSSNHSIASSIIGL
jgi:hypothetical protein